MIAAHPLWFVFCSMFLIQTGVELFDRYAMPIEGETHPPLWASVIRCAGIAGSAASLCSLVMGAY